MQDKALLLVLTLLCLGASGCLGGQDPTGGGDGSGAQDTARALAGTFVPWTLSDHWTYDMELRGLGRYESTKLIYYEESGPEYVVGAPTYEEALYHAVFSVNPILGRIHAQLLSPHERGEHAHMFPFHRDPVIEDGETWNTIFYERQVGLTADYDDDIATPTGPQPGFRIEGKDPNSAFRITYSYVRDVKWFTYLTATDEDGTVIDLQLTEYGTGYKGKAHFIRAKDFFVDTIRSSGVLSTQATFDVTPKDVEDKRVESFAISADIEMRNGITATLILRDPSGSEIWRRAFDDPQDGEHNIVEVYPGGKKSSKPVEDRPQWPAGEYTLELRFTGEVTASVHLVGTQDNSGSI